MNRVIKLILKYLLVIPFIFVASFGCSMRLLQDIHKKEIHNESDIYPYGFIVQSAQGIQVLWGREEFDQFLAENKDVRFLIQPGEMAQVQNYCLERERAIGLRAGPILNAKQEITLTIESGPGLYSFIYEATVSDIKPLCTNRYTIVDVALHFGIAGVITMALLFAMKKVRQRWLVMA